MPFEHFVKSYVLMTFFERMILNSEKSDTYENLDYRPRLT